MLNLQYADGTTIKFDIAAERQRLLKKAAEKNIDLFGLYTEDIDEEEQEEYIEEDYLEEQEKIADKQIEIMQQELINKNNKVIYLNKAAYKAHTEAQIDPGKEIYVMIDPTQYKGNGHDYKEKTLKPKAPFICNGLKTVKVNIKTLVDQLCTGHAIRLGVYGKTEVISKKTGNKYYKFNSKDFKGTTSFYVDVDNNGSMYNSLELAKQYNLNVAAILPSISYTKENQKHHILFVLDRPIFDEVEINKIIEVLVSIFNADSSCDYISKFLYPSWNKPYYTNYTAINKVSYLKQLINGIKITKNEQVQNAETVDITSLDGDKKSVFESSTILNLYNNIYKINMGGVSKQAQKTASKLDIARLDELLNNEIFVKKYGFLSFNNAEEIKDYLKSIPLQDLLQVNNPSSFKCLFHKDNSPSAAITFINNTSIYSCFSDSCIGTHNDIFNIVAYVLTGNTNNFIEAFTYLVAKLNLSIKNIDLDFYKKQTEIIKQNRYVALTANKLGQEFKNVRRKLESKYTNMLIRTLMDIAEYTLDCCPKKFDKNEDLIFTASASFLKNKACFNSQKLVRERLDDLVAIGFLEQITDEEVKRINISVYNSIMELQKKNLYGKAKTINCYKLKRVDTKQLLIAEELFKNNKKLGATRKGTGSLQNTIVGINNRKKADPFRLEGKNKEIFNLLESWYKRTYTRNKYILKNAYLKYAIKNNISETKANYYLAYFNMELGLNKKVVSKDLINKFNIPAINSKKTVFI